MKKINSFLMLLIMTVFNVAASAKTFTITVDDQNHIGRAMITNNYNYLTFVDNKAEFEAEEDYYLMIEAASGYQLATVTDEEGNSLVYSAPTGTAQFALADLGDHSTIVVTTSEKEVKLFTFTGDERLTVTSNYGQNQYYAENDVFTVPLEEDYSSVQISSDDPTIAVKKVVSDSGREHWPEYGTVSIYAYEYEENTHFTVETYNPEEARTATMTVKVNGNANDVVFMRNFDYEEMQLASDGETTIKFNPETETDYTIRHSSWGQYLYQVKKNGEVLESGTDFNVTVEDGDNIEITPAFPDVDVPVSFSFVNEGTEDAISVMVDYTYPDWKDENFSVKLGSRIAVYFNSDYDVTGFTVNGETPYYGNYYEQVVASVDPLNFVVTAEKKQPKHMTIHCENYENIVVYKGYSYMNDTYELTGSTTEIEVDASVSIIQIEAAKDWVLSYIEDSNGQTYTSGDNIYVSEGLEVYVGVEKLNRDRNLTVYVGDGDWTYRSVILSQYNYDIRQEYSYNYYEEDSTLPVGYTTIAFGAFDCPIAVNGAAGADYSRPIVYLNNQLCELNGYSYEGLDDVQDGDVLKLFAAEPETYTVTYDIDNDANVEVIHDHTRAIATPTEHSELEGTEIWVKSDAKIEVTANSESVTANEDGVYVVTVNADTTVKITSNSSTGIQNVEQEAASNANVYNLQGLRVGTVKDASRLPAGVYIINGKKVRF